MYIVTCHMATLFVRLWLAFILPLREAIQARELIIVNLLSAHTANKPTHPLLQRSNTQALFLILGFLAH
jgi:hypothetical protein